MKESERVYLTWYTPEDGDPFIHGVWRLYTVKRNAFTLSVPISAASEYLSAAIRHFPNGPRDNIKRDLPELCRGDRDRRESERRVWGTRDDLQVWPRGQKRAWIYLRRVALTKKDKDGEPVFTWNWSLATKKIPRATEVRSDFQFHGVMRTLQSKVPDGDYTISELQKRGWI